MSDVLSSLEFINMGCIEEGSPPSFVPMSSAQFFFAVMEGNNT